MNRPSTRRPLVLPVIHLLDPGRALASAQAAFDAGCDGVWLISMDGQDQLLQAPAVAIKERHPGWLVGVNYLSLPAPAAIERNVAAGLDMTWSDNARVTSGEPPEHSQAIARILRQSPGHQFFGGVAFKYQAPEPDPGAAARRAAALGMVPTTSGEATARAASLEKIRRMREALGDAPLAVASGITADNARAYAPYLTHILVATGVSNDCDELDFALMARLMARLKIASSAPGAERAGPA